MALTYVALASVTVGSGGAATIVFNSIPNTYTDLLLKCSLRSDQAVDYNYAYLRINGSGTQYSVRLLYADSNTAGSTSTTTEPYLNMGLTTGSGSTASTFSNTEFYIPNYAGSTNKSVSSDAVTEKNASTNVGLYLGAGLWSNTAAITSLTLLHSGTFNFVQYSTATLYGIKNTV